MYLLLIYVLAVESFIGGVPQKCSVTVKFCCITFYVYMCHSNVVFCCQLGRRKAGAQKVPETLLAGGKKVYGLQQVEIVSKTLCWFLSIAYRVWL